MGATSVAFLLNNIMNIYIYSDESGVFDYLHNDYFIFGGLICFGNKEKETTARKYSHAEKVIIESRKYDKNIELKASNISNADKGKLFRSLNNSFKFSVLIKQKELQKEIFENKRHKQRFLDYAYKIVLKKCFNQMISKGILNPDNVEYIFVSVDEHTTATDGKYELKENLLNEFKNGTFNYEWDKFFEPIFNSLKDVIVKFCDSGKTRLVRAADIVANHCYYSANKNHGTIEAKTNMFIYVLPSGYTSSNGFEYFNGKCLK
jgi:hypothetical protein